MLFFKTVLTVEHIELQKPFYFNKKEIFLLFTLLWTKDWSQFLSVLPTCIFTWFYSMSFFFFLNHICLFCVATFSNAILCNIKSCFQWIEGLVTSHIRGQNQLARLNDLLSQYSWRQKGTFISTLFQSISEQNYKYNAIDLFIFLI